MPVWSFRNFIDLKISEEISLTLPMEFRKSMPSNIDLVVLRKLSIVRIDSDEMGIVKKRESACVYEDE